MPKKKHMFSRVSKDCCLEAFGYVITLGPPKRAALQPLVYHFVATCQHARLGLNIGK